MKRSSSLWLGRRKARDRKRDQRLMREGKLLPADVSFGVALGSLRRSRCKVPEDNLMDDDGYYL